MTEERERPTVFIALNCPHCDNQVLYSLTQTQAGPHPTFVVETHWSDEGDVVMGGDDE